MSVSLIRRTTSNDCGTPITICFTLSGAVRAIDFYEGPDMSKQRL